MDVPTKILIVEDNPDDETLLLRQLKKAQLDRHVRIFADGSRAVNYLLDEQCKCEDLVAIFLDLNLPGLHGVQILEKIRSVDRIKHLPVILMTSSNSQTDLERCRELGVSSHVTKPVTYAAFSKAVADSFHPRLTDK